MLNLKKNFKKSGIYIREVPVFLYRPVKKMKAKKKIKKMKVMMKKYTLLQKTTKTW
jgi:hypothetical protein